jgi:hypothetical protein
MDDDLCKRIIRILFCDDCIALYKTGKDQRWLREEAELTRNGMIGADKSRKRSDAEVKKP